jgi:ABC-type phosphate/phosphonate transport system permease subunit
MKKIVVLVLGFLLLLSSTANCLASTSNKSNTSNNISKTTSPMISNWHYQNDTPLVGTQANYNQFQGRVNKDLTMSNYITKIGQTALQTYIAAKLPSSVLAKTIAATIFTAVFNNPALDTPSLYYEEDTWYYGSSLNYQVCQYWYADAAHTKYITYTTYFGSFY